MIVGKEFLSKLKDFGLNSYEVKLWVALLSRGVSTAGELSDIANVPRSRTYDVLESLEKKGFIVLKIGKPIKYMAIEPSRVVDVLKKNIQTEAKSRSEMIDGLRETDVLKELQMLHTNGIATDVREAQEARRQDPHRCPALHKRSAGRCCRHRTVRRSAQYDKQGPIHPRRWRRTHVHGHG
jgi:predicted transcriptional regulator